MWPMGRIMGLKHSAYAFGLLRNISSPFFSESNSNNYLWQSLLKSPNIHFPSSLVKELNFLAEHTGHQGTDHTSQTLLQSYDKVLVNVIKSGCMLVAHTYNPSYLGG
jgi:hypothetical protein